MIASHGLRQEHEVRSAGTTVTLYGRLWSLELFYGSREGGFSVDVRYGKLPRQRAVPLWAVFQALSIDPGEYGPAAQVSPVELRRRVAAVTGLLRKHWEVLDREPDAGFFREIAHLLHPHSPPVRR